ncbi:MAG: serine/threonine-protein phosphatase [Spirochaetes bacterium]|nr:serine/threonine-protein phosphatase [Spirochaetota bacterium]MBN2772479.1 serine/threonine-protein phosphatase [Spirochaetota bacterium]
MIYRAVLKALVPLCLVLLSVPLQGQNLPIDLTNRDFYVRQGFYPEQISTFPPSVDWKKIVTAGYDRALTYPELFKDEAEIDDRQFTLLTSFHIDRHTSIRRSLGISIPLIGSGFELYLNGKSLYNHFDIDTTLICRNKVIEIPFYLLNDGFNVLCIRVKAGDDDPVSGIITGGFPFSIDFFAKLQQYEYDFHLKIAILAAVIIFATSLLFLFLLIAPSDRRCIALSIGIMMAYLALLLADSHYLYLIFNSSRFDLPFLYGALSFISLCSILLISFRGGNRYSLWIACYLLLGFIAVAILLYFFGFNRLIFSVSLLLIALVSLLFNYNVIKNFFSSPLAETFFERIFPFCIFFNYQMQTLLLVLLLFVGLIWFVVSEHLLRPVVFIGLGSVIITIASSIQTVRRKIIVSKRDHGRTDSLFKEIKEIDMELVSVKKICESVTDDNVTLQSKIDIMEESNRTDSQVMGVVQSYIFPRRVPETDNYEAAFITLKQSDVSGDMYDFYTHERTLKGVSLFETTSHGLAPGLVTILMRSIIYKRFIQLWNEKLSLIFEKVQKDLNTELGGMNIFLSGKILKFDQGRVEYVNAGHTDILFRSASNGVVRVVAPAGRSFKSQKMGGKSNVQDFNMLSFSVKKGDIFLLFTDGFERCQNRSGAKYGLPGIIETFESIPEGRDIADVLDYFVKNLNNHRDGASLDDDITIIVVRKL